MMNRMGQSRDSRPPASSTSFSSSFWLVLTAISSSQMPGWAQQIVPDVFGVHHARPALVPAGALHLDEADGADVDAGVRLVRPCLLLKPSAVLDGGEQRVLPARACTVPVASRVLPPPGGDLETEGRQRLVQSVPARVVAAGRDGLLPRLAYPVEVQLRVDFQCGPWPCRATPPTVPEAPGRWRGVRFWYSFRTMSGSSAGSAGAGARPADRFVDLERKLLEGDGGTGAGVPAPRTSWARNTSLLRLVQRNRAPF